MTATTPPGPPSEDVLETIEAATTRLLGTVTGLADADWGADTVLPGWTRAHVVAHLALNGDSMAGVLDGLREGVRIPMYPSDARRDDEIDELATADPAIIRERLGSGTTAFADSVRGVPEAAWAGSFDRLPSGPRMPAGVAPGMRHREVEIHHADLGAGYGPHDWPDDFLVTLLDTMAVDHAASGPFRITATDLLRSWQIGDGGTPGSGPEVTGTGPDLGWWLLGRERSADLRCVTGSLPEIGPWRRSPLRKD